MSDESRGALATMIGSAWRRRYLIVIPILVMPTLGVFAGRNAPTVYEARMTILIQNPAALNPVVHDFAIDANLGGRLPALAILLSSKHVLIDVLKDIGGIGPATDPATIDRRVGYLKQALSFGRIGPEMIELKIRGGRPDGLARTLSAVGARYIERVLQPGRGSVESSATFLRKQVDAADQEISKAALAYSEFEARNADKLSLRSANVDEIARTQQFLQDRRIAVAMADAEVEQLKRRVASLNPVLGRLEDSIVKVSTDLATLRARYTDDHSEVQAALRTLKRLEEERNDVLASAPPTDTADMDRLWNMASGGSQGGDKPETPLLLSQMKQLQEADTRRTILRKQEEELSAAADRMTADVAELAEIERQEDDLKRALVVARERRDALNQRFEAARLAGSFGRYEEQDKVKIIDAPQDPTEPITPSPTSFVIGGLVGGLILGAGLASAFEVLDTRLRRPEDFAEASGLPVLAVISRSETAA